MESNSVNRLGKVIGLPTWIVVFTFFLCLLQCQSLSQGERPYLVLYAFEAEGWLLADKMDVDRQGKDLGRPIFAGRLSGKGIVLAESGMGMTNAAMMTQRLIDQYDPKAVIFTGIAGAVDSTVRIGDIVVCREWITHDYIYHGVNGPEPSMVSVYSPALDSMASFESFSVDSAMYAKAAHLVDTSIKLRPVGDRIPVLMTGGIGVSGNAFIDNREKRIWLQNLFQARITDMETAAVAQVCFINGIPFIAFRSASDLAGGSGSSSAKGELSEFFDVAAENSAAVVMKYLDSL